jgi:ligand-binding sensor domain-containing protein/signal transduction histidine kinase
MVKSRHGPEGSRSATRWEIRRSKPGNPRGGPTPSPTTPWGSVLQGFRGNGTLPSVPPSPNDQIPKARTRSAAGVWSIVLWLLGGLGHGADLAIAPPPQVISDLQTSEYLVDVWGTDRGLPNNTVTGLAQAADGFLWCATYDGVVRFDGVRFVRVGPDDPANQQANRVLCLHLDRRGQLWLGTDGAGLLRHTGGTAFTRYAEAPGSAANSVRWLAEDAGGDLWLGTRGGLGQLRAGKVSWFTDATGFTNASKSIWNLAFDGEGRLWIADWSSLKAFQNGRFESALLRPELKVPLRAVHADHDGNVWAGMLGKAVRRQADGQWLALEDDGQFANTEVAAFCQTRSGDFWIGTRKGLFRRRGNEWKVITARDGLISSEVRVLFEDREGNLWIGTGTGGLARLKRRVLTTYTGQHGLTDGGVQALREKAEGGLWVGMAEGQVAHGTATGFQRFQSAISPQTATPLSADAPVKSLLHTRDGALWVGTFGNGLTRFHQGRSIQFVPSVGSPARIDKVISLLEDRSGAVWVGTFYSLYKATGTNVLTPVQVGGRELRSPVTALLEDRAGGLWVACDGLGVARLFGTNVTWLTRQEGLPTHFIRTLHEDAGGTIWIGTTAGLCSWREGTLSTFTSAHGLIDQTISQILEDDAGNLWLGSNQGIMRVAKSELQSVGQGRKNSLEVFAFGRGEGMLSVECSGGFSPAGLKTRDGKLWFPTTRGLVMADPAQLKLATNPAPPPVYIEEVRADGKAVAQPHASSGETSGRSSSPALLTLPHGTRRVEFVYTALSLTAPDRVRFKHRLEGFDPDWTEPESTRSTVYAQLRPADYRFQVIACNNDGLWNETGHALAFRIAAPFWQTWWFLALSAVAAMGTLGAGIRFVSVRQLRRKLRRLEEAHAIEKERMRIAQDMHDEIGGKLSRISFLSDMAHRDLPQASAASQQINEVSEAARDVINTVDEIVWAVSPRNDTLESLAHYICRHAEEFFELTPIELELELPPEFPAQRLSADVRHNLFCAVKEALNNVLKHARSNTVRIALTVTGSAFQVTIKDHGCGLDSSKLHVPITGNGQASSARRGNGMFNMQERLESVHGSLVIESQPGQGTKVTFSVPLH